MRYFLEGRNRHLVDDDGTCNEHHVKNHPPLFHIVRSPKFSLIVVRCPKSLTEEERQNLNDGLTENHNGR